MKKLKSIAVFCAVSSREIDEVQNWLITSLLRQKGVGSISLYLVNYPGKDKIYNGPRKIGNLEIEEISKDVQCGFGESHNFAFKEVGPKDYFLIVNPGFLHEECVSSLIKRMDDDIGIVEARQLPFSHPKEFDLDTGETPWSTGSCLLINSIFFKKVSGFDENFWMYVEDVDLSWRAWLSGYRVIHEKNAVLYHYTGAYFGYSDRRYYLEQFWGARNFLYLMYKYWGEKGERKALRLLNKYPYPTYFKKEVKDAYRVLKSTLDEEFQKIDKKKLELLKDKIKVLGFTLFHKVHENEN